MSSVIDCVVVRMRCVRRRVPCFSPSHRRRGFAIVVCVCADTSGASGDREKVIGCAARNPQDRNLDAEHVRPAKPGSKPSPAWLKGLKKGDVVEAQYDADGKSFDGEWVPGVVTRVYNDDADEDVQRMCPPKCKKCGDGSSLDGGEALDGGICRVYCSKDNKCGLVQRRYGPEGGGVDCTGCGSSGLRFDILYEQKCCGQTGFGGDPCGLTDFGGYGNFKCFSLYLNTDPRDKRTFNTYNRTRDICGDKSAATAMGDRATNALIVNKYEVAMERCKEDSLTRAAAARQGAKRGLESWLVNRWLNPRSLEEYSPDDMTHMLETASFVTEFETKCKTCNDGEMPRCLRCGRGRSEGARAVFAACAAAWAGGREGSRAVAGQGGVARASECGVGRSRACF